MTRLLYRVLVLLFALILFYHHGFSQEIKVRGKFLADSVMIGAKVAYTLSVRHASKQNILFPDSADNFFPFEFLEKKYVPTKTKDGTSYDSAVYYLQTFEVDSIQTLTLPLYVVSPADCTRLYPAKDSIRLASTVNDIPDSVTLRELPLKPIVTYEPVPFKINYLLIGAIAGSVLFITIGGWALFGKKIRRYYLTQRLRRNYEKFIEDYAALLSQIKNGASSTHAESTLFTWKKYMENLEYIPYTKLTTRETARIIAEQSLKQSLQAIDRAIYGNQEVSIQPFETLRSFAEQKYMNKLEEVKHG